MNTWFRFYSGSNSVPKIQNLSGNLFKTWVNLLCIASENNSNRGTLPSLADVAFKLRQPPSRVKVAIAKLIEVGLIDMVSGEYLMHDWKDWQFDSDNSTFRVKQFRQRQRNVSKSLPETDQIREEKSIRREHTALETSVSQQSRGSLLVQANTDENARIAENAEPWTAEIPLPLESGDFVVSGLLFAEWKKLYPALNVLQELRQMRAWLLANPTRRKTARGMPRFCTNWLNGSQNPNHGRPNGRAPASAATPRNAIVDEQDAQREAWAKLAAKVNQ